MPTYRTDTSSHTCNYSGGSSRATRGNCKANAGGGSNHACTLEYLAVIGLNGELDGFGNRFVFAASESIGRCGGDGREGGDEDTGETHVGGLKLDEVERRLEMK